MSWTIDGQSSWCTAYVLNLGISRWKIHCSHLMNEPLDQSIENLFIRLTHIQLFYLHKLLNIWLLSWVRTKSPERTVRLFRIFQLWTVSFSVPRRSLLDIVWPICTHPRWSFSFSRLCWNFSSSFSLPNSREIRNPCTSKWVLADRRRKTRKLSVSL